MEEYDDQEMVIFKYWPTRLICIPCDCEFEKQLEQLLIDFFITP